MAESHSINVFNMDHAKEKLHDPWLKDTHCILVLEFEQVESPVNDLEQHLMDPTVHIQKNEANVTKSKNKEQILDPMEKMFNLKVI